MVASTKSFWSAKSGGTFFQKGYGAAFQLAFHQGVTSEVKGMAKEVEQYAKDNAPWTDNTGDAREGLKAEGDYSFTRYTITLFHTVDYGIWLEILHNGRYAIIIPTIERKAPELTARLQMAEILNKGGLSKLAGAL